ncbi:MAG: xanthine/uracil permease [Myxococcota bacterium]|jgi:xanthine/uracil permease
MAGEPSPRPSNLLYSIEDKPPLPLTFFLGLQHYLTMVGATVVIPYVIQGAIGFGDHELAQLIATMFFVSGITTLLQSTFGNRLPIIQGGTFSLLAPTFAVCGMGALASAGWEVKMLHVQVAIIGGGAIEAAVGYFGLVGRMLKYIGPITIAPTIALIGLSLFGVGAPWAGQDWYLGGLTIVLVILFSQYLKGMHRFFAMFPILLSIGIAWGLAAFLTWNGTYGPDDPGFVGTQVIGAAPLVRIPYPFQWGTSGLMWEYVWPATAGMLAGFFASIVESIGDYYACARLSGAPIPTKKIINRGIGMEGLGSVLAGVFGTGNATTSYSENIGAIGLTGVGSRRVIQSAALTLLALGLFGKFSAVFATIPKPIVGGLFCALFGMIASVGLSNLQFVDLNSSRNLFIIGFAMFMGLTMPQYFNGLPAEEKAQIPATVLAIGSSGMSVGAILALILDNTIPGTDEERGLTAWSSGP